MERGKIVCLTFETFVKAKGGRGEDWSGGGWVWGGWELVILTVG